MSTEEERQRDEEFLRSINNPYSIQTQHARNGEITPQDSLHAILYISEEIVLMIGRLMIDSAPSVANAMHHVAPHLQNLYRLMEHRGDSPETAKVHDLAEQADNWYRHWASEHRPFSELEYAERRFWGWQAKRVLAAVQEATKTAYSVVEPSRTPEEMPPWVHGTFERLFFRPQES